MSSSATSAQRLKVQLLFALIVAVISPRVSIAQRELPNVDSIDRIVRTQVDSGFSGVVLIARKDSVLLRRAYGPLMNGLRANTTFWIASMTKGFTAAAVLRLQQMGRLRVTDSISRFFPNAPSEKRNITVHQLLTHTSGFGGTYTGGGINDRADAVRAILAQDLIFSPGRGYKYGDDNYELLAAIIEIVSGKRWENYVRTNLIAPLHLKSIGFACDVTGHKPSSVPCDWGHKGADGMFANADDLLTWSRTLVADRTGAISHPQVAVRKEPPFDVSYGYGVRVYTLNGKVVEVMHAGSGDNDNTSVVRNLSSGLTIIVLSNAGQHGGTTWASYVARQLVPNRYSPTERRSNNATR